MPRFPIAIRLLVPLTLVGGAIACAEPVTPRPRTPSASLSPKPRVPVGSPVDSTAAALQPPVVHPVSVAIFGLPTGDTITVGEAVTLSVQAIDSAGAPLTEPATWSVSDSVVAQIGASSGRLVATRVGAFRVGATLGDTTAWVTVVAKSATPPPSPSAIALKIVRMDGGTGPVVVSSGVPLIPGALLPGQEGNVHVTVGGVERAVHVAGLQSRHPDGSLRAVLVQFNLDSLGAVPDTGTLALGAARDTAFVLAARLVEPGASVSGAPLGLPQAAALPSDPAYLVATDLVGPTMTSAATAALGGMFARYEKDFATNADRLWGIEGANWAMSNYYDRALIYYAFWARTGNATYWARAGQIAHDYRRRYLEPNNYGASPHNAQLEGMEKHYLLTGDEASRIAVVKTGYVMWSAYLPTKYMTGAVGESRIAARVLHSQLLAWRLTPAGAPPVTGSAGKVNWPAAVESAITKIAAWQAPDGSYPATIVCGGQLNYMVGLLNDALIKTHDYYVPPTSDRAAMQGTVRALVTKAVEYLWTTQWRPDGSFNYASVPCPGVGSTSQAPDLNNLISAGFAWAYRQTGDATLGAAGDQIFTAGVGKAYLAGTKQFNENYTSSFRFLGYR